MTFKVCNCCSKLHYINRAYVVRGPVWSECKIFGRPGKLPRAGRSLYLYSALFVVDGENSYKKVIPRGNGGNFWN